MSAISPYKIIPPNEKKMTQNNQIKKSSALDFWATILALPIMIIVFGIYASYIKEALFIGLLVFVTLLLIGYPLWKEHNESAKGGFRYSS